MVKASKHQIVKHLSATDFDELDDAILPSVSNSFLDKALSRRLETISGHDLINALARAERLGYNVQDVVAGNQGGRGEHVIPSLPPANNHMPPIQPYAGQYHHHGPPPPPPPPHHQNHVPPPGHMQHPAHVQQPGHVQQPSHHYQNYNNANGMSNVSPKLPMHIQPRPQTYVPPPGVPPHPGLPAPKSAPVYANAKPVTARPSQNATSGIVYCTTCGRPCSSVQALVLVRIAHSILVCPKKYQMLTFY